MPPRIDRDFPASQYFAAEVYGEQPSLKRRRRPPRTPDEETFPGILAQLKALTGFEPPPITVPEKQPSPDTNAVIFDAAQKPDEPDAADPTTDAEGTPKP